MFPDKVYAHSLENRPSEEWQLLRRHLFQAARLCADFADAFHSREWGLLAGLWHDLGKYQDAFQRRLKGEKIAVEHAGVGACLATELFGKAGFAPAFPWRPPLLTRDKGGGMEGT